MAVAIRRPTARPSRCRLRADITLGSDKIAFERLKAEIDRKTVDGRLVYLWATDNGNARLDAELNAAELDVDSVLMIRTIRARQHQASIVPGEVSLAIDIGRATIAGIEARNANAKLTFDAEGLRRALRDRRIWRRLAQCQRPDRHRGSRRAAASTLDLDARDLSGLSALAREIRSRSSPISPAA